MLPVMVNSGSDSASKSGDVTNEKRIQLFCPNPSQ